jgi:hypothetical protein
MPRKSEQQLTLEEQHRLWMARQRKARTLQQQVTIQKIITGIEAKLWPNPAEEAREVAKAAKRQLKAEKVVEPEAVVNETALEVVLEQERQRRETPEPSIVFEHARRAEVKAEIKKEREAVENPPITGPQNEVISDEDGVTPPAFVSQSLIDMWGIVTRAGDGDEHDMSVGMTNALLSNFESSPEPHEPVGEGGYLVDWAGNIKPRT